MSTVIRQLRQLRVDQGLTQADVAEVLGVHRTAVESWERGRVEPPTSRLELWAAALGQRLTLVPVPAEERRTAVAALVADHAGFMRKRTRGQ